jgi:UDP-N-acetylglucosamine 1-carboxyvinyltransferase
MRLMERVGRNIKRLRRRHGWTQAALAERIGTSQVYVAQVEGAVKELSLEMLGRFAKALRMKPGRLLD